MGRRYLAVLGLVLLLAPVEARAAAWTKKQIQQYEEAMRLVDRGRDYERAAELLETLVLEIPHSEEKVRLYGMNFVPYLPHFHLGRARFHLGQYEQALEEFEQERQQGVILHGSLSSQLSVLRDLSRQATRLIAESFGRKAIEKAGRLAAEGLFARAEVVLAEALDRDPSDASVSAKLQRVREEWRLSVESSFDELLHQGLLEDAEGLLRNLRAGPSPFPADHHAALERQIVEQLGNKAITEARRLADRSDYGRAAARLTKALDRDPSNASVSAELQRVREQWRASFEMSFAQLIGQRQLDDAESLLDDLRAGPSPLEPERLEELESQIARQRASVDETRLAEQRRQESLAELETARGLVEQGRLAEARTRLRSAVELDPDNWGAERLLGDVQALLHAFDEAERVLGHPSAGLDELREQERSLQNAAARITDSIRRQQLIASISLRKREILDRHKKDTKAQERLDNGLQEYREARFEEAITWFRSALEKDRDNAGARAALSRAEQLAPLWHELQQALAAEPDNPDALRERVEVLLAEARLVDPSHPAFSEIGERLEAVVAAATDRQHGLADLQVRQATDIIARREPNFRERALVHLRRARELAPGHEGAGRLAAELDSQIEQIDRLLIEAEQRLNDGNVVDAEELIKQVVELDPGNARGFALWTALRPVDPAPDAGGSRRPPPPPPVTPPAQVWWVLGFAVVALVAVTIVVLRVGLQRARAPWPGLFAARPAAELPTPGVLQPGTIVGNYQIDSLIREGGMARIYKVVHPDGSRVFAMKTPHRTRLSDPAFVDKFRQEADLSKTLAHPNIVSILDVGSHDGLSYFVMEYVEGQNLRELMQAGQGMPLNHRLATEIVHRACQALHYAHTLQPHGLIHKDIKPENIMVQLSRKGELTDLKLIDFGISQGGRAGELSGTPPYVSPEQAARKELDGRSDLFALGVVFYELVTGSVLFWADNITAMLDNVIHKPVMPPPGVDPVLTGILMRMLAKDPKQRLSSSNELAVELQMYLFRHTA